MTAGMQVSAPAAADLLGHGGMVRAAAFSADGQCGVTGSFDFSAIVWDFGDQWRIATLNGHDGPVTNVAFLNDGHVVTADDVWKVLVWKLSGATAAVILRLEGHLHKVMALDKFLPGTKMPVQRVPNREKLAQLVDYLKVLTGADSINAKPGGPANDDISVFAPSLCRP